MKKYLFICTIILIIICIQGCTNHIDGDRKVKNKNVDPTTNQERVVASITHAKKPLPNEAGRIMILMYHDIGEPEKEFQRTPKHLREDLQYLYDHDYRPIKLKNYINGKITTKAGYKPIVITFDDGYKNQFRIFKKSNGQKVIDPNCAVGILEEFHKKHADFSLRATFFINDNIPFGQEEYVGYKIRHIIDQGMDIGNHTASHIHYRHATKEDIQRELGSVVALVDQYLKNYNVNTHALPFGERPKEKALYPYLKKGCYKGYDYENIGILNVGWDPARSPFHVKFDPKSIHRVRGSDLEKYVDHVGMYDWLNRFEKGELAPFVSDGDPLSVTIPKNYKEVVDVNKLRNLSLKIYD